MKNTNFAVDRIPTWPNADALKPLIAARQFSDETTQALQNAFERLPDSIASIAVCGSVKRLEAHSQSDLDLIVIVDDRKTQFSNQQLLAGQQAVWSIIRNDDQLKRFQAPKAGGLFSECASWKKLIDTNQRGVVDEDIMTFGHRIHLLMDAVPVASAETFHDLHRDILNWYSEDVLTSTFGDCAPFEWLKHDVLRYWHSILSRSFWLFRDQPDKSATVSIKVRSSRLMQVAAFLLRLQALESLPEGDRLGSMLASATRSPLDTILPRLSAVNQQSLLEAWQEVWLCLKSQLITPNASLPKSVSTSSKGAVESLEVIRNQIQTLGISLP